MVAPVIYLYKRRCGHTVGISASGGLHCEIKAILSSTTMATVLAANVSEKTPALEVTVSVENIPVLGAPVEERRFWFQRDKTYNPEAIATQVSAEQSPCMGVAKN